MSYAIRNSLILGVLLVLVWSLGYFWVHVRQPSRLEELYAQESLLSIDLDKINRALSIYDSTRAELEALKERRQKQKHIVPAADDPAQTLAYLNRIARSFGSSVQFNFFFKGHQDRGRYSINRYALEGEGRFEDFHAVVSQLENGRRFYTVDQLQCEYRERDVNEKNWEHVQFRMIFRAYFEPDSGIGDEPTLEKTADSAVRGVPNPFRPLITKSLPENRAGLFEVDEARLRGLTYQTAYLEDAHGQDFLLREGDRVFMGRLSKIDIQNNRVEFVLNRGGIWERLVKTVALPDPQL